MLRVILNKNSENNWVSAQGAVEFCSVCLEGYFNIPKNATEVDLLLTKTPKPNSFKITDSGLPWKVNIDKQSRLLYWCTYKVVENVGLPCYISLEV